MTTVRVRAIDRQTFALAADWLAVGVAVSLPWSTSATGIFIALWLVAALPALDIAAIRRELVTAAGGLPVLLWLLAACGMLWADVTWNERFGGLDGFNRLVFIPLLLAHFRRSERGMWVLLGYFLSVLGLMLLSWALVLIPGLTWRGKEFGVPVKDYILQSESFVICAFALLGAVFGDGSTKRLRSAPAIVALAFLFFANVFFVADGRTVYLVAPVLLLLLGGRQFGGRGVLGAAVVGCMLSVVVWFSSPYLRQRVETSITEFQAYRASDAVSSTAMHIEFLRKSLSFVTTAPIIGHGTGSIPEEFRNAAIGQTGDSSVAPDNPHNQIFAVAIQLGSVGAAVLIAMWIAHLMLFRGGGLTAWIGLIIVVQNVVSSLVNSHLFDFSQGWLYVFAVGVAGGMCLRDQDSKCAPNY